MAKKSGTPEAAPKKETDIRPRLVSVQQAADLLGIHTNTVRKLLSEHQLQAVRYRRILRITLDSVQKWIDTHSA